MKLIGTFHLNLSHYFLVKGPTEETKIVTELDGFEAKITLIPNKGQRSKKKGDKWYTFYIPKLTVSVSRIEKIPPPNLHTSKEGKTVAYGNIDSYITYFDDRGNEYKEVAKTLVKRLARYFKYELRNPLINEDNIDMTELNNPEWTNEAGKKFKRAKHIFVADYIPGMPPGFTFGSHPFRKSNRRNLLKALKSDKQPELYEELISDAQAAVYQKNPRRAILELAIACEIAVKFTFFTKDTPASSAYEYLEDSRRVNITVLELIDGVAKQAFGSSFKETNPSDYVNINFLFRCRNKIAHRGEIIYKDANGRLRRMNQATLEKWWKSVDALLEWLKKKI